MSLTFLVLAAVAAVGDWAAVARRYFRVEYLLKPLTTLLIAWSVWRIASSVPRYRTWLLVGLVLSTLGDVFLMLPVDAFVPGLASFLLAHLAYLLALNLRRSE